ncbi:nanos homolog 3-like [Daphnia pulicaria]|uniref:nanos homolog 3-like n=1 Tax=Daphnia pulicaria TaxID=35523 RepID=UPI001EEC6724|nr:nanos homolog 3-like [Daphnia pulicaria]
MIRHQYLAGRALTKKSVATTIQSIEEDDGYGTSSPTIDSPQLNNNIFTFVEPSVDPTAPPVSKVSEDEWSSLEKELNQVLNMQPLTESRAKPPSVFKLGSTKMSIYSTTAANKQPRVNCQFCAKNGEIRSVVESHTLRHPITRAIICPVLRKYVCEMCGATGDNAHTKFYCPENRSRKIAPMAILLKTTRNNATGKRTHM